YGQVEFITRTVGDTTNSDRRPCLEAQTALGVFSRKSNSRETWMDGKGGIAMPLVKAGSINVNYEKTGSGEPLVLIPYLGADQACYAFQVAEYAKHFTCISVDLRGAGLSDKPAGTYTTELFADDVAQFMDAIGLARAHISGVSLGAAAGMWLA